MNFLEVFLYYICKSNKLIFKFGKVMMIKISEGSKKRCRKKFPIKRIGKLINSTVSILDLVPVETVISECIYDHDNKELYNVLLFLIRENCIDKKIINELKKFDYYEV